MIKHLQDSFFSKTDILAMLNTLFPPSISDMPNDRISKKIMRKYRKTLYQFITAIDTDRTHGRNLLDSFIDRLFRPTTGHSWTEVIQTLNTYLELAELMIEQAATVHGVEFFRGHDEESLHGRSSSITRSDYSDRPSTSSSNATSFDEQALAAVPSGHSAVKTSFDSSNLRAKVYAHHKISGSPEIDYNEAKRTSQSGLDTKDSRSHIIKSSVANSEIATTTLKVPSKSFSRPTTPVLEARRQRRKAPDVPGAGSDQLERKQSTSSGRPSTANDLYSLASKTSIKSSQEIQVVMTEVPRPRRKSSFGLFGRTKKQNPPKVPSLDLYDAEIERIKTQYSHGEPQSSFDYSPTNEPYLKKKSSFSFLGRKSSDDSGFDTFDRRSEHHPTPKLKPQSFSNILFSRKKSLDETSASALELVTPKTQKQVRKVRSSTSMDVLKTAVATASTMRRPSAGSIFSLSPKMRHDSNLIITSADISEPFPFGPKSSPTSGSLKPSKLDLSNSDRDMTEELQMEYARSWYLEEARLRKLGLPPPEGKPTFSIKEPGQEKKETKAKKRARGLAPISGSAASFWGGPIPKTAERTRRGTMA
jgi:hypothetical protein